jgi:hypothetical protein
VIVERLRRPDLADLLRRDDAGDLERLEAETVALRSRLDSLAGLFAQGNIDTQQLGDRGRDIRETPRINDRRRAWPDDADHGRHAVRFDQLDRELIMVDLCAG